MIPADKSSIEAKKPLTNLMEARYQKQNTESIENSFGLLTAGHSVTLEEMDNAIETVAILTSKEDTE